MYQSIPTLYRNVCRSPVNTFVRNYFKSSFRKVSTDGIGFRRNLKKGYSRQLVPRLCSICRSYHKDAGNQANEVTNQNQSDIDLDRVKDFLGTDGEVIEIEKAGDDLHIPVMKEEVLWYLGKPGQKLVDMTFGAGGHTRSLLDHAPDCHVFALDRDPFAHNLAIDLAKKRPGQITPLLGRFSELPTLLAARGVQPGSIDGVLFDLGCSSMQFDQSERGFSLSMNGPLDMRMDGQRCPEQPTAADVVNTLDETDLIKIFKKYGEEKRAGKMAHAIIDARAAFGKITQTRQLADIIDGVCSGMFGTDSIGRYRHPATKIFQALRIFVNNELNELNSGLEAAHKYLKPGGTCVAISFHSLEDRIVKRHFHTIDLDEAPNMSQVRRHRLKCSSPNLNKEEFNKLIIRKWKPIYKKITVATPDEVERNPRSRSAKLRAAEKLLTSQ